MEERGRIPMFTVELLQQQPAQFGIRPVVGIVEFRSHGGAINGGALNNGTPTDGSSVSTTDHEASERTPPSPDSLSHHWIHPPANLSEGTLDAVAAQIASSLTQKIRVGTVDEFDWEAR